MKTRTIYAYIASMAACSLAAAGELPYAAGIKGPVPREKMQEVVQRILDEGVAAGWQSCAQCCVYIDGKKVVDAWAGVMDKESKRPIDGDTLLPVFSSEKPLLATAMHIAHDKGLVDYDDPVSRYWPEFTGDGKEKLTIRQLLGHRAGMPAGFAKYQDDMERFTDWNFMAAVAAAAKPVCMPGTRTGYLSQSYGWYVGAPLTRIFKKPINDLLTDEVLKPAGIERDFYFAVPESELGRCATVYADSPGDGFLRMNRKELRMACIPSAYAAASARGLAKFYMRLAGMDGKKPLIRRETLVEASRPERWENDPLPSAEELVGKWQMVFALGWGVWGDPDDLGRIIGQGGVGGSEGYGDVRNRIAIGYTCGTSIATPNHDLRPAIYRACGIRTRHMPRPLYTDTPLSDKSQREHGDRGCATPESQGVDSQALLKWIAALEKFEYVHGFVVRRHGFTIAEGSWKPFDTLAKPHMLYSHSKSFTSTAIGFLVDDGKLDLDERVVDILPEYAPPKERQSENLRKVRVRDLLTMNAGTSDDVNLMTPEGDWIKAFFDGNFATPPGTKFGYSTISTHVLGAIVEKRSGMDLMKFLKLRLFDKIGIRSAWTTHSPTGLALAGSGMRMTTRDLSLFGQFYLQEGEWNGERLLSREWVRLATSRQSWSRGGIRLLHLVEQGGDWEQGYGFQFWRCRHDSYRADGACGQLTLVVPKKDMVISIQSGTGGFQDLLDTIWNILMPGVKSTALDENPEASEALRKRCAELEIAPVTGNADVAGKFCGRKFMFEDNPRGFRSVQLCKRGGEWTLRLQVRGPEMDFAVGRNRWREGKCVIDPEPDIESWCRINGEQAVFSSGAVQPNGDFVVRSFLTETPTRLTFRFHETNGVQKVSVDFWAMGGCRVEGNVAPPPNPVQLTRKAPSLRAVPEFQLVEPMGRGRHPGKFRQANWVMGEKRVTQMRWPWGSADSERDHQTLFFQPGDRKLNEVHVKFDLEPMADEELGKWNLPASETTVVDDAKGELRYERPYVANGVLSKLSYVARATGRPGEVEVVWNSGAAELSPIVHWENKGSKWTFRACDEAFDYSPDDVVADGLPHVWRTVKDASTVKWGDSGQGCTISGLPPGECRIEEHAFDWLKGNTCRMLTMHLPKAKGGRILIDMGECPRKEQNVNKFPAVNGMDFSLFNGIHFPLPSTRNELRNPSFEQGFSHWTYCHGVNGRAVWQEIADGGLFGKKALLMKTDSTDGEPVHSRPSLLFSMPQQLEYRARYVLSFYAKSASKPVKDGLKVKAIVALGSANKNVSQPGAAGQYGDAHSPASQFEVSDEWRRFERPFTGGPGGFRCILGSVNGDVLFDGLQLERGEKATEFVTAPVEPLLVSSADDNQLKPGDRKDFRVLFTGRPGTAFSARVAISNYYRENVHEESMNGVVGDDGTVTLPLSPATENIGTGVFPVRFDVSTASPQGSQTFYQRIGVMEPLTKADLSRPTKNLVGTLCPWPSRYGRAETFVRKLREWGVGSTSWGGVSQLDKPKVDFELLYGEGIVNVQHAIGNDVLRSSEFDVALFEDRKESLKNYDICRDFCKLPINDAQQSELVRAQVEYLKNADPRSALALSWWNEEEGGPGLVQQERYEDYFRYQKATYDAIMATGHKFKTTYSSGVSSIVDYKLPIIDAYLSTARRHGIMYDVMTFHAYGFLDGGRLGQYDIDAQMQKILGIMSKNGYSEDTEIYITELGNEMQLQIPEWNTLNGDTYGYGLPEYCYGQYEALNAASCARIWIMMMKYAPRIRHTNIWNSRPFMDATFTPLFICKAMNTFAHLFPDARFVGEVKKGADVRAYVFTRPGLPAIGAIWQTRPSVDVSEEACPTAAVRFSRPVRCIDLMENERCASQGADGKTRFALTWAPLFFEAEDADGLLSDLNGIEVSFAERDARDGAEQRGHALAGGEQEVINQQGGR